MQLVRAARLKRPPEVSSTSHPKLPPTLQGDASTEQPLAAPLQLVNAFWSGNRVCLISRDSNDVVHRRFVDAEYTCFVRASELDERNERKLRESHHVASMKREGSWWRIRWYNYNVLRSACQPGGPFDKAELKVYEADVRPVRRFLTDNNVQIQRPKRCYIDLEVDSRVPILRQIEGHSRVLSWALCDDSGRKVYGVLEADTDDDEVLLLTDLWDELLAYDQVCAWGGDRYDFEVLRNRSERLAIQIEPRRWLWLDHLEVYRRLNMSASESGEEKESMALDRVAQAVLGRGKTDFDSRRNFQIWQTDKWSLVDYNIEDVVLMRDIEAKTGFLELHFTVCETCNTFPDSNGTNPTNFVEGYLLKLGLEHDEHFPTHFDINFGAKYEGAYVMEPTKTGILKGVHVCDFASLYPSIIISWNISPETLTKISLQEDVLNRPSYLLHAPVERRPLPPGHAVAPYTGKVFRTDKQGILPIALERLGAHRSKWKKIKNSLPPGTPEWKDADRRTSGYKITANSFYGVVGSVFSRFFVRACAESTTLTGKYLIEQVMKQSIARGLTPIYGDTDSVFVEGGSNEAFTKFVAWCNAELFPAVLKEHGCVVNKVALNYEKKFSRLILMKKKRYAGKYEHFEGTAATADSKPEIKGLEFKRGDTIRLAREMQYELVQLLLDQEIETVEHYREWIGKWRDRILVSDLALEDIRMSNSLGKDLNGYARREKKDGTDGALPVHVEVALVLKERGRDVGEGVRIEYIVVDGRSPIKAIPVEDFAGEFDRCYLWENLTYPASQRVLEAALPQHKWRDYLRVRPTKSGRGRIDALGQALLFKQ